MTTKDPAVCVQNQHESKSQNIATNCIFDLHLNSYKGTALKTIDNSFLGSQFLKKENGFSVHFWTKTTPNWMFDSTHTVTSKRLDVHLQSMQMLETLKHT